MFFYLQQSVSGLNARPKQWRQCVSKWRKFAVEIARPTEGRWRCRSQLVRPYSRYWPDNSRKLSFHFSPHFQRWPISKCKIPRTPYQESWRIATTWSNSWKYRMTGEVIPWGLVFGWDIQWQSHDIPLNHIKSLNPMVNPMTFRWIIQNLFSYPLKLYEIQRKIPSNPKKLINMVLQFHAFPARFAPRWAELQVTQVCRCSMERWIKVSLGF